MTKAEFLKSLTWIEGPPPASSLNKRDPRPVACEERYSGEVHITYPPGAPRTCRAAIRHAFLWDEE